MSEEPYKPPRAPAGLGATGRRRWHEITRGAGETLYVFRIDELADLEAYCRQLDDNARLEKAAVDQPVFVEGSRGQLVMNPIFAQIMQGRITAQRLKAGLGLGDADADAGLRRSSAGRKLARTRWNGG